MKMMRKNLILALTLLSGMVLAAAPKDAIGFDPEMRLDDVASMYFAPENTILFRMRNPDGSYREFQRNFDRPNDLWGARGWRGKIKGERVVIKSGPYAVGGPLTYVFDRGRLVSFTYKGERHDYAYDAPRPLTAGGAPRVFGDVDGGKKAKKGKRSAKQSQPAISADVEREFRKKWATSGRLRVPFDNPNLNGFLYMSAALLSAFLFFVRYRWVRILGGVLFAVAFGAMVMAASRGAFLSMAMALVVIVSLRFKTVLRSKSVWVLAAIVLTAAVAWFATHESRLLTRGFTKASRWSNETRLELWGTAPTMMAEAPDGWGSMHVGRAHLDWYQDLDVVSLSGSLINDHLTRLVAYSRIGRFGYIFGWLALLGLLGFTAWRTREGVAFGFALAVAVAAWFNPVLDSRWLWILPGCGLLAFLATRPWRAWRVKPIAFILLAAALVSGALLTGVMAWGAAHPAKRGYPIHVENERVIVKGTNPKVWIVDDRKMLGGVFACKDIRGYYAFDPHADSVGYVRRVRDLPKGKVHRLVLTGKTCSAWLKAFGKRVESEGEAAVKELPDEIVFIAPDFSPAAVPAPYLEFSKVRIIIGEFLARYLEGYDEPPEWTTVVPAVELYLNGWMEYALGLR